MSKKITILEDDQGIRELCAYFFISEGYRVNSFGSISEMLKSQWTPNLYLLDIRLPDGNGLDVCSLLKNSTSYAAIPIIMMSAHMEIATMTKSCKADYFIEKPFDLDNLLKQVEKLTA